MQRIKTIKNIIYWEMGFAGIILTHNLTELMNSIHLLH